MDKYTARCRCLERQRQASEGVEAVGFTVVYFAGRMLRHIGGTLLLCWRRVLSSAFVAGGVSLLLAEIVGSSVTHQIPASIPAQIVAVLFAIGMGYSVALTTLLAEIIGGALEAIHLLEGEVGAGARAAAVIGERADRELSGFVGWVDAGAVAILTRLTRRKSSTHSDNSAQAAAQQRQLSASTRSARLTDPQKGLRAPALATRRPPLEFQRTPPDGVKHAQVGRSESATLNLETLTDIAATEEFMNTAPRPKVNARPVPADQLPRIEWAYEKLERQEEHGNAPAPAALTAPLEWQMPLATADEDQSLHTPSPPSPLTLSTIPPATGEVAHPPSDHGA